jgi:hypothetical protein
MSLSSAGSSSRSLSRLRRSALLTSLSLPSLFSTFCTISHDSVSDDPASGVDLSTDLSARLSAAPASVNVSINGFNVAEAIGFELKGPKNRKKQSNRLRAKLNRKLESDVERLKREVAEKEEARENLHAILREKEQQMDEQILSLGGNGSLAGLKEERNFIRETLKQMQMDSKLGELQKLEELVDHITELEDEMKEDSVSEEDINKELNEGDNHEAGGMNKVSGNVSSNQEEAEEFEKLRLQKKLLELVGKIKSESKLSENHLHGKVESNFQESNLGLKRQLTKAGTEDLETKMQGLGLGDAKDKLILGKIGDLIHLISAI